MENKKGLQIIIQHIYQTYMQSFVWKDGLVTLVLNEYFKVWVGEGYLLVLVKSEKYGFEGELILYDLKDRIFYGTADRYMCLYTFYGMGRFFKYTLQNT